jgi:hypothetical protein
LTVYIPFVLAVKKPPNKGEQDEKNKKKQL